MLSNADAIVLFAKFIKSGTTAAEALRDIPEGRPVFFCTLMRAARDAMKQDVMQAMRVFAKMDK